MKIISCHSDDDSFDLYFSNNLFFFLRCEPSDNL